MCIIIASPEGKLIEDNILDDAGSTNRDGNGLAWYTAGSPTVNWKKGLNTEALKALIKEIAADGKTPYVAHFRIATVGGTCDELTHPFSIDERASIETEGTAEQLLFHNGSVANWKELLFQAVVRSGKKLPPPPWSDTRALAWALHVYGPHFIGLLENYSRFLVFDAKQPADRRFLMWGKWSRYKDCYFSNEGNVAFRAPRVNTPYVAPSTSVGGTSNANPPFTGPSSSTPTNASSRNGRSTTVGSAGNGRRYIPQVGFDPWKPFTPRGTSRVIAVNEQALTTAAFTGEDQD